MPTLFLNRTNELVEDDGYPDAAVVCEPRAGVSRGTCARVGTHPDDPLNSWATFFRRGESAENPNNGAPLVWYVGLEPGIYEAHSTLRSHQAIVAYLRVTADGHIVQLGHAGDEDVLLAALHGMTIDELRAARAAAAAETVEDDLLAPLQGTARQVKWAEDIRERFITTAFAAGDDDLACTLAESGDASWFIAHREDNVTQLRARLLAPTS